MDFFVETVNSFKLKVLKLTIDYSCIKKMYIEPHIVQKNDIIYYSRVIHVAHLELAEHVAAKTLLLAL